jgi:hypothetical protein
MRTPLLPSIRYPWLLQAYDSVWLGRRDANRELAHEPHDGFQPSASLRRFDAALQERCETERRSGVNIAAPLLDRREYLARSRDALRRQLVDVTVRIEEFGRPAVEPPGQVRASEAHLSVEQRAGRRARELAGLIAPLRAERDRVAHALDAGEIEIADIEGRLRTLWESIQAKVSALGSYYERRCSTLVRGYLRRTPAGADHPLNTRTPVRPPAWAFGPNPWITPAVTAGAVL